MEELKPFKDVPQKFNIQLKRSFVATRAFYKALIAGRDIITNIMKVSFIILLVYGNYFNFLAEFHPFFKLAEFDHF